MKNFATIKQFGSTLFLSLALALGLAAAENHQTDEVADPETGAQAGANVTQFLEERGDFQTLLSGFETAGLTQTIHDERQVTVIAPRDQAFEQTAEGADAWSQDTQRLTEMANVHVLDGVYTLADLRDMTTVTTVQGQELQVETTAEGDVTVGGVRLVESDFRAGDDVVHVADTFISPDRVTPAVGGDAPEDMDQPEDADPLDEEDDIGGDLDDDIGEDTGEGLGDDLDDTDEDDEQTP